jgi:hypothetical protein
MINKEGTKGDTRVTKGKNNRDRRINPEVMGPGAAEWFKAFHRIVPLELGAMRMGESVSNMT